MNKYGIMLSMLEINFPKGQDIEEARSSFALEGERFETNVTFHPKQLKSKQLSELEKGVVLKL